MSIEQQFVEKNREYLLNAMHDAPEFFSGIRAAGLKTVKALFRAVLENEDYRYLPFCLFFIHDGSKMFNGKEIKNDEGFALNSLLWIHEHGGSAFNAYILAYALRYDFQLEKCEELLWTLEKQGFSSALIVLGDLELSRGKREKSLSLYKRASNLGHFMGWVRRWEVERNDGNWLNKAKLISHYPILHFSRIYHLFFGDPIKEKFLYLKFYFEIDVELP